MEAKATLRFARVAPDKVRQVIANVRDLPVDEARDLLVLESKAVAHDIRKLLDSAVANAENNLGLDADELFVVGAEVNEGPVLRRFRPRAMGRATCIRKRTSHITITVGTSEPEFATATDVRKQASSEDSEGSEDKTSSGGEQ